MRPFNTSTLIAPGGSIAARSRKVHLFDVAVDRGPVDTESARVTAGDRVVTAVVDGVTVGLSICYDVASRSSISRWPSPARRVLMVPSNFTERTGRDHWEVSSEPARSRTAPTCWRQPRLADHRARRLSGDRWSSIRGARSSLRRPTQSVSPTPNSTSIGSRPSGARSRCWRTGARPRIGNVRRQAQSGWPVLGSSRYDFASAGPSKIWVICVLPL
jgi:hypothetical protein